MSKFLTRVSMIAMLGLGPVFAAPVLAQSADTKPAEGAAADKKPAGEGEAKKPDNDPAKDLNMGQAAQEVKKPYIKEEHGDWKLQCLPTKDGKNDPCQMYQLLKDDKDNGVAEVALFRLPKGSRAVAGATVTVPLETLLTGQLTVRIDGGKAKRYPFAFCSPVGCYARIGFTAQDIAAFKKGASATVTLVPAPAPDQKVTLKMSLKGFTAGYEATSIVKR